jgi:hypothetical protein
MKTIQNSGAQGDVFFTRVEDVPADLPAMAPTRDVTSAADGEGDHVLAHSETGHHHTVRADGVVMYRGPEDPFTCYLKVDGDFADVVHHRPFDTHETLRLTRGAWLVRRQREYTPSGFRRVED